MRTGTQSQVIVAAIVAMAFITSSFILIGPNVAAALSAPSELTLSKSSGTGTSTDITLTWTNNSPTEACIKVERNTGGGFTQVATTTLGATSYIDSSQGLGTYAYRVRAYYCASDTSYSNTATTSVVETLAFWEMNGVIGSSTKTTDSSSGGLTLTEVGSPTSATGTTTPTADGAYSLNGSTQYLTASDTGLVTGNGARTIEAWVKRADTSGEHAILSYGSLANYQLWKLSILGGGDGRLHTEIYGGGCNSTGTINDTSWHYIAAAYDGTTVRYYVDGVSAGSCNLANTPNTVLSGTTYIGVLQNGPAEFFSGSIDQVRVSNGAKSDSDISAYYNISVMRTLALWNLNGSANSGSKKTDDGPSGLTLTEIGSPTSATGTTTPTADGAYTLNGSSQYLSAGDAGFITGNGARTIDAWVKRANTSGEHSIFQYGSLANYQLWKLSILGSGDGRLRMEMYGDGCNSTGTINDTNWHYVAATYNGTTVRYYIDGSSAGSCTFTQTPNTALSGTSYIGIVSNGPAEYFSGYIDRVRFMQGEKTASEISDYFNSM
jgi:hypothetical protein